MKLELKAEKRDVAAIKAEKLRERGAIPAELYGQKEENEHLSVAEKDFSKVFKEAGENTIVYLNVDGKETPVLVYDIDQDRITGKFKNIDFYRINMKEKVTAEIPLAYKGESPAVKDLGAILVKVLHQIEVEALPQDLPHEIEVDLSILNEIGKNVHVKDLSIPKGVKINLEEEAVVATVKEKKEEKVEEAQPVDLSKIEVEGEKKEEVKEGEEKEEKKS